MRKIFVLDTNVVLHDPYSTTSFDEHKVVIPMTVLEELDNIKSGPRDVSREARVAIRHMESIIQDATHQEMLEGVQMCKVITHMPKSAALAIYPENDTFTTQDYMNGLIQLDESCNDNKIINAALALQYQHQLSSDVQVILVSNDINMRLKAKGAGVEHVESYSHDTTIDDIDLLPSGYIEVYGDFWEQIGNIISTERSDRGEVYKIATTELFEGATLNDYIIDDEGNTLARIVGIDKHDDTVDVLIIDRDKATRRKVWGITPKDNYQTMAINALMDPTIDLVILTGPAGTGKTLITLAAALEQVLEKRTHEKVIFSRSLQSQFEEIGFLPGNEHEKVSPWAGGAFDALEFMHKSDANPAESVKHIVEDRQIVQFKALNFIRGRSFQDTILIIDEAQNLTATQMKTIISRAGQNTKVVLMGNLAQIDNDYVTALSSGLTYVVDKFKDTDLAAIVQLQGVVRSRLADYAEKNL